MHTYICGPLKGFSRVVRAGLKSGFGVGSGGIYGGGVDDEYPAVTVGVQFEVGMVV